MNRKKNILLVSAFSIVISTLFIFVSTLFVKLTNYDPIENHLVLNILVWGIEFIIAYFFVMGLSHIICKKIKLLNKWLIYLSLLETAIFVTLLPGGLESIYLGSFFAIISFFDLIQSAYKQKKIKLFDDEFNEK